MNSKYGMKTFVWALLGVGALGTVLVMGACKKDAPAPSTPAPAPAAEPAAPAAEGAQPAQPAAAPAPGTEKPAMGQPMRINPEELRARMQELNQLGAQKTPEAKKTLVDTANNESESIQIRIAALKSLTRNASPDDQNLFRELMKTLKAGSPLYTEAAVGLYRSGATTEALPLLKEAAKAGHSVSQAFFLGFEDGKRKYAPEAGEVFAAALESKSPYAKLKAAGDLLFMGSTEQALKAFDESIADQRSSVRMAALNYLQPHLNTLPAAKGLIEKLAQDTDEKVRARAERVLKGEPAIPMTPPAGAPPAAPAPAPAAGGVK